MAKHHQEAIKAIWYESVLFNFVAYSKKEDVLDEAEYEEKYGSYGDLETYVNSIVEYIHDAMPKMIKWLWEFEIERKFLIKTLPENINKYPSKKITQWFFKDKNNKTIRIRKAIMKNKIEYFQTIKKWHWLIRKENEINLSKEDFDKMWKKVWKRYLNKTRYIMPYKWKKIEVDIYEDKLKWLITAEIEFNTLLESRNFIVPKWFGKEITEDRKFTNANLAKK
jgi:CYTH domain-containing protein